MPRYVLLVISLLLGTLGCTKPTAHDFVGTWVLRNERRLLPHEVQNAMGAIVLNADGTFSATELPMLFWDGRHGPPDSVSGTGGWKLSSLNGEQVELSFCTFLGSKPQFIFPGLPESRLPYGTFLNIRRAWFIGHKLTLSYMAGPDEKIIEFEKKP